MPQQRAPVVVVLDGVDSYQLGIFAGLRRELGEAGVPVVVELVRTRGGAEPPSLARVLTPGRVSGVVVFPWGPPSTYAYLEPLLVAAPDVPRVFIANDDPAGVGGSVRGDNDLGVRLLARHLVEECGVRRVLAVRGMPHNIDSVDRERVLLAEFEALGVPLPPEQVVTGEFKRETTFRVVTEVLRDDPDYDAIVCFNDRSAIGAIDAAHALGLRVPDDVMVTGFDDDTFATLVRPPLTTVGQDLPEQGARAARMLLQMMDGAPAEAAQVPVSLVVRGSTRPAAGAVERSAAAAAPGQRSEAEVWSYVWNTMTYLDTVIEVSRNLLACDSSDELIERMGVELPRLEVTRAFLVLRLEGAGTPRGLLALSYHGDQVHDVSAEEPFDLADLLPPHLADHLATGWLTLLPLGSGTGEELGYLLVDQLPDSNAMVSDTLGMDLSRALEAIRYAGRMARHTEELEALVVERTRQLESELAMRRATESRLSEAIGDLQVQISNREAAEAELMRANQKLLALASVDGLTGVANRAAFDEVIHAQVADCSRAASALSVVMIDVDRFKAYNDEYGHLAGDEALRVVARCLRAAVQRPTDLAARYGGEEFAIVLPNTGLPGAVSVAERVRAELARVAVPHRRAEAGVLTVSMGVATVRPNAMTEPSDIVAVADRRLYHAKHAGRDRIMASEPVSSPGAAGPGGR